MNAHAKRSFADAMESSYRRYDNPSVCDCGFPVLSDEIPIGKLYEVKEESIRGGFVLICGGCGKRNVDISVIYALDGSGQFKPLPVSIFGPAGAQP